MQSSQTVFRNYSRSELDREYNNSNKVDNAASIIDWYRTRSAEYTDQAVKRLDLQYGTTESQALDLYFPNGEINHPEGERPLHVFFHGGYWQAMHKQDFSYVANAFTHTNAIVAIVEYDLIPQVDMTELVDQCRQSLSWLYRNIASYGGNPESITLSGHSAGGHLTGMMMATNWPKLDQQLPQALVKAGVSLSGLFDLEPVRLCYLNDDLKLSEEDIANHSPVRLGNINAAQLYCLYGEKEGDEYERQSQCMTTAWERTSAISISGHNHFSIAKELDNPLSEVSGCVQKVLTYR